MGYINEISKIYRKTAHDLSLANIAVSLIQAQYLYTLADILLISSFRVMLLMLRLLMFYCDSKLINSTKYECICSKCHMIVSTDLCNNVYLTYTHLDKVIRILNTST